VTVPVNHGGRHWAIVPAAGQGARFGAGLPKQYAPLLGRPMLSWTLAALLAEPRLQGIMVALAPGDSHWRTVPEMNDPRVRRCEGGDRREHTVARGLDALAGEMLETDWALVHDAARPCLRRDDIALLIDTLAHDTVGGLLALPLGDTLKRADDAGCSLETVPRDQLWRALTPQMFRAGLLRRALGLCRERDRAVTDEASAIESLGLRPRLLRGHADNIKVTNPEDAVLAEAILRRDRQ
jgi:2-C-methyl-D-erythritol 4-phosphate cytidylyltransferase